MVKDRQKKVLLGHLNSNGDCLFATVIARQIKEVDYPGCHLTWAVNSKSKQSIYLNPYVDEIWEIPTEKSTVSEEEWKIFTTEAESKRQNGEFDFVFLTQIMGDNFSNYDGGIRSSIYNNYPHEITVSYQPTIRLSEQEVENVKQFSDLHNIQKYKNVILVECGPDSFTSSLNMQSAYQLAVEITEDRKDTAFILSSNKQFSSTSENIIDGSSLTYRENAELTKYCNLLVGCGSGISWLTTTDWAKKLNTILVVNDNNMVFPSMIYDHEYINLPTDNIIEIQDNRDSLNKIKSHLSKILDLGFPSVKESANDRIYLSNFFLMSHQIYLAVWTSGLADALAVFRRYIKRNGIRIIFNKFFIKGLKQLVHTFLAKTIAGFRLKLKGANGSKLKF